MVLLERGEEKEYIDSLFKKGFPWKWADAAVKHKLRIINWPAELKKNFPSPGFDLSHIKEENGPVTQTEALRAMHRQLKAIYQGQEPDTESDSDEAMDVDEGSGSESDGETRAKAKAKAKAKGKGKGKAKKPGPVTIESWTEGTLGFRRH